MRATRRIVAGHYFILLTVGLAATSALAATEPSGDAPDREQLHRDLQALTNRLTKLRAQTPAVKLDYLADAEIYAKAVRWALHFDEKLTPADVALMKRALIQGAERVAALEASKQPWAAKKGKIVRAYRSKVDGSVQPFGVIIPAQLDPTRPMRLDVVLHGSSQPVGMSELRFMSRFDEGDGRDNGPAKQDYIELHPLGRVENCYRWAGETDVFEAIEAACRNYPIDRDRIVLRGMSMGASGTWHLGLKHPDRFVALGPYCGYVDTHRFSETPLPNFVKVGPLPAHQEKMLHLLDSIDYAANAGVVPAVACMGEKDIFFQAHVLMGQAMEKEGLKMVNLISPGTGHVIDPVIHKEQMRQLGEFAAKGLDHRPKHVRFVTWTLKYSRCHWLQILRLDKHYARAELEARLADDGSIDIEEPKNVTLFALRPPMPPKDGARLRVGRQEVSPLEEGDEKARTLVLGRRGQRWELVSESLPLKGKRPGLQGPIDDAFTSSFLCVRGTGKPWNPAVQAWAEGSLKRFAYEWRRYFRGELPLKDDTAVTEEDIKCHNLILFGDPGSNRWIEKVLPRVPIHWNRTELQMGTQSYPAADHAPVLIQPNPFNGGRYLVFNSGHTFHEKELASLNYLLFPRLGDWAVFKIGTKNPKDPSEPVDESVVRSGFFDEDWK